MHKCKTVFVKALAPGLGQTSFVPKIATIPDAVQQFHLPFWETSTTPGTAELDVQLTSIDVCRVKIISVRRGQ